MTKDIIVSIKGLQFTEDSENVPVEVITHGEYYKQNGKHYVIFEEISEEDGEKTKNILKVSPDCLEVTKKGGVNVHMIFEKDKKNVTYYYTAFGSLLIGIEAREIRMTETEDDIDVQVQYALEANYQLIADCSITIGIKSGHSEGFKIE